MDSEANLMTLLVTKYVPPIKSNHLRYIAVVIVVLLFTFSNVIMSSWDGGGYFASVQTNGFAFDDLPTLLSSNLHAKESAIKRLCTQEELRHGRWLPVTFDKPPYIPTRSKCYKRKFLKEATSWESYEWHPFASKPDNSSEEEEEGQCDYAQWNKELFCELAHNRTIVFVGDSLTWEQFSSLAGLHGIQGLGGHYQLRFSMKGKVYSQQDGMVLPICNEQTRIAFMRNRYLANLDSFMKTVDPDILVLNRGAHYVDDQQLVTGFSGSLGIEEIVVLLQDWQKSCKARGKDHCLAIWRTTTVGHPYCHNFTQPATSVPDMERLVGASVGNNFRDFHYWDFKRQNGLVLSIFENTTLHFDALHAYDLGILRPDAHVSAKDCLHSCDPGAVDAYNNLLLHLLRLHRSD
jgi:hypothetical protein